MKDTFAVTKDMFAVVGIGLCWGVFFSARGGCNWSASVVGVSRGEPFSGRGWGGVRIFSCKKKPLLLVCGCT